MDRIVKSTVICSLLLLLSISGCQSHRQKSVLLVAPISVLSMNERWAVSTLESESVTSTAADEYLYILETYLSSRGILLLQRGHTNERYTVSGHINSERTGGLFSQKLAVEIRLSITDTRSKDVVWSRSLSRTGNSQDTVSDIADKAINELVKLIPLSAGKYFDMPGLEAAEPVM